MATPPGGGGDVPQAGYYPDPSIPGYIRYWNGGGWVPGTSRPAPKEGEALPAPPVAVAHPPAPDPDPAAPAEQAAPPTPVNPSAPEVSAAPVAAAVPAVPAVEETGPVFFDEDPGPVAQEPASVWQATTSRQTGFGGERDQMVSWGRPEAADPRAAPAVAWPGTEGAAEAPALAPDPAPAPLRDHATTALAAGAAAAPAAPAAPVWPAAGPAPAASDGVRGTGTGTGPVPPQGARTAAEAQARPAPAPAQAAQAPAPAPAPVWPESPQPAAPGQLGQQLGGMPVNPAPALAPWAPQAAPAPRTPQPAQPVANTRNAPSAPSAHAPQAAQAPQASRPPQSAQEGAPPVVPWKPPVEDPFLAAAREQASARPAGMGRRLLARIVDGLVFGAALGAVAYPLGSAALTHIDEKIEAARQSGVTVQVWLIDSTTAVQFGIILAAFLLLGVVYEALPTAKWGRTLGKKLCGIQVRDIEAQEPPAFGAALRRWLVYGVLGLLVIGVLNVLWCLFDRPWRQCWHDKAAGTFVAG